VLERSGKEKSQSERVLKENENARTTTHKQREEPLLVACSSVVKQPEVVFVFFFCSNDEDKREKIPDATFEGCRG
jgi:hypothetical protein